MKITQWGEYGIHCCLLLAREHGNGDGTLSAAEIAGEQHIDMPYAQQIIQRLRKSGIVSSVRGAQGGYRLSRSPDSITLLDILAAEEGDTFQIICNTKPIDERCESGTPCNLRPVWFRLREHIDSFLSGITLADLAREGVDVSAPVTINARRAL